MSTSITDREDGTPSSTTPEHFSEMPAANNAFDVAALPEASHRDENPPTHKILLKHLATFLDISYDTMMSAHGRGELAIIRDATSHHDSVWVHVREAVRYAEHTAPEKNRWKPIYVSLKDVVVVPGLQPRHAGHNPSQKARAIKEQLRRGGTTRPVYVSRNLDGQFEIIDGHSRYEAHVAAQKTEICVIVVLLPRVYVPDLARALNVDHGENLTPKDQAPRVESYLRANRNDTLAETNALLAAIPANPNRSEMGEGLAVSRLP